MGVTNGIGDSFHNGSKLGSSKGGDGLAKIDKFQ